MIVFLRRVQVGGLIGVATGSKNGLMPSYRYLSKIELTLTKRGWYKIFSSSANGFYGIIISAYLHKRDTGTLSYLKTFLQLDGKALKQEGNNTQLIGYTVANGTIDVYIYNTYEDIIGIHLIVDISGNISINTVKEVGNDNVILEEPSGIVYIS